MASAAQVRTTTAFNYNEGRGSMMRQMELGQAVIDALECSVYLDPTAPGLAPAEIVEALKRIDYHEGEIRDAIHTALASGAATSGGARIEPGGRGLLLMWDDFNLSQRPDYRNIEAFNHTRRELRDVGRNLGADRAEIERTVLVDRAVSKGVPRRDVEAAIQISLYTKHFTEKGPLIALSRGRQAYPLPSEQAAQRNPAQVQQRPRIERIYAIVRDVLERRTDGRSNAVEPLDAFAEQLALLGYGQFRSWWIQTVSEMRLLTYSTNPVAASVLSAALVEGALTFVVKHARATGGGVGPMGSKGFDSPPNTWKIDDLVASASRGDTSAILDPKSRTRAEDLIKVRQRIHAGRMLADFPDGVPDLRPEEARDAALTADLIVRRVIDWISRRSPAT